MPIAKYTYNGETHPLSHWSDQYDISVSTIHKRLEDGYSFEMALLMPLKRTPLYTFNGKTQKLKDWCIEYSLSISTMSHRLRRMTFEKAIVMPVDPKYKTSKPKPKPEPKLITDEVKSQRAVLREAAAKRKAEQEEKISSIPIKPDIEKELIILDDDLLFIYNSTLSFMNTGLNVEEAMIECFKRFIQLKNIL